MEIQVGQRYAHYKGGEYTVIALAYREEDTEPVVVYQAEYDTVDLGPRPTFVRTLRAFSEVIEVNGKKKLRFERLDVS